jgi:hypothetical protein
VKQIQGLKILETVKVTCEGDPGLGYFRNGKSHLCSRSRARFPGTGSMIAITVFMFSLKKNTSIKMTMIRTYF